MGKPNLREIRDRVAEYYSEKVGLHGCTPMGVDWNSKESHELRFKQLLNLCPNDRHFSLIDFGCGYGALYQFMIESGYSFNYTGFDIAHEMIQKAEAYIDDSNQILFTSNESDLVRSDYTIASGIFNVKMDCPISEWKAYIFQTLDEINRLSIKGFSFNILTSYSDRERMREDLYYADPKELFAHCKQTYSKYVALLHDYPLYEFTIIVRKEDI